MSDYRRLISYIYEYEGKEKGKNVGFVKLEARNGQCRMNISVKNIYVGGNPIGVYLLGKQGQRTFLGNIFVRGGIGEFRTVLDSGNIEGMGDSLDSYYGLTVHDIKNPWRAYTTIWEDIPVEEETSEGVIEKTEATDIETGPIALEILPGGSGAVPIPEMGSVADEIEAALLKEEEKRGMQTAEIVNTTEPVPTDSEEMTEVTEPKSAPELENPDVLKYLQDTEDTATDPEQLWQELRKSYPKIQPFEYGEGSEVLTIRPQDIGLLPRENWIYGNNSFLLHGYYNFRYLILARLNHDGGAPRYLLGIPGHYYSNEKYMATMFGFPNFVLSKKQPPNDGRFGYWYTDIKMR